MIEFFIKRPIFAAVIALLILIGGGISILALPIAQFPQITPPTVQVTSNYPGASATTTSDVVTRPLEQAIPELVETALRRGGARCDNVTVLAMEWETADEYQTTRVSTDDIEEGVFASTIQSGVPDPTIEDLDDAAIERSIAEINAAIQRTAAARNS